SRSQFLITLTTQDASRFFSKSLVGRSQCQQMPIPFCHFCKITQNFTPVDGQRCAPRCIQNAASPVTQRRSDCLLLRPSCRSAGRGAGIAVSGLPPRASSPPARSQNSRSSTNAPIGSSRHQCPAAIDVDECHPVPEASDCAVSFNLPAG